jgi:alkylation response protein AidB-like acyl-CoA dehydrogenase
VNVTLTAAQQRLRVDARAFAYERVRAVSTELEWREDPRDRVAWTLLEEGDRWRLLGVPPAYGGPEGVGVLDICLVIEELSAGDMGFAVLVDQCIKICRIIARMATPEQSEWFFPQYVADPRCLLSICITEPAHGTDNVLPHPDLPHHLDTDAAKDGNDWIIAGEKRYISNGADASFYLVFACTDREVPSTEGTSAFLIPANSPGLHVTKVWNKISQRGNNNATIRFDGVVVPEARRLGRLHRALHPSNAVLRESAIEAGITALGSARAAYEAAQEWARRRVQGGVPIVEHPNVAIRLGRMATLLEAARCLAWHAAASLDADPERFDPVQSSMVKAFAAEVAFEVAREACEIHGGAGIMIGESIVEKTLRDTLSFLHSDGTQDGHLMKVGRLLSERDPSPEIDLLSAGQTA